MYQNTRIPASIIRQLVILAVLVFLFLTLYKQLSFMLTAFLGAIALYMLMRKPLNYLMQTKKWKMNRAATILILLSVIVIVLPVYWAGSVLINEFGPIVSDTAGIQNAIEKINRFFVEKYNFDLLTKQNLAAIPAYIGSNLGNWLGATFGILTNLILMYFLLWFMLTNNHKMEIWVKHNLPMSASNSGKLLAEVENMVVSNTVGIPAMAVVQGLVALVGYLLFDVNKPVMWAVLTGLASVIPFVGTMAAWVPLAVFKIASGDTANGYWLMAWGFILIGGSDNVIRMVMQKYIGNVHPIITVLGVILGINMFGFLGIIFGPLLISIFLMLAKIYNEEFVLPEHEKEPEVSER